MVVSKRIIILIIAIAVVVLVIELAWAYSTLYKSSASIPQTQKVITDQPTKITLSSPINTLKVGDQVTVTINLSSTRLTDGTDVIINFDPKVLTVVQTGSVPVTVGSVYTQYPNNKLDATKGIITASGISSEKNGSLASGVFGTIVFRAKSVGSTNITLVYSPDKTDESNIIETATGKDILGSVENLQFNITP